MKKIWIALFVFGFILSACSSGSESEQVRNNSDANGSKSTNSRDVQSADSSGGETTSNQTAEENNNETVLEPIEKEPAEQCKTGTEHPIAVSIAEQYAHLTDYDEVVGWFCEGAIFEDILNALTTEELSDVDAGDVLLMVAEGMTWDEIWLELGITEE